MAILANIAPANPLALIRTATLVQMIQLQGKSAKLLGGIKLRT